MPRILYKMLVIEFNSKTYRLSDRGWNGITYEVWDDMSGYSPLYEDQVAEEFTADDKYKIEMLFDE